MDKIKLSPANIVILAAGVVILIGSFLDFYKAKSVSIGGFTVHVSGGGSAWSSGAFLIATLPAILGIVMAVHVALTTFADVGLPDRVLGLTWNQIHVALGFQAAIMMLAFLIRDKGPLDFGIGFWLMLIAAIGLLVGAILRMREPAGEASPPMI
jgi:hypothetical protein